MNTTAKYIATGLFLILFSSCSSILYKQDLSQGSYPEKSEISKLKIGMNKDEVTKILGTPTLVNPLYPNKWAYIYTYEEGFNKTENDKLLLDFNDNKLTKIKK